MLPNTALPKLREAILPKKGPINPGFIIKYITPKSMGLNNASSASSGYSLRDFLKISSKTKGIRHIAEYKTIAAILPVSPDKDSFLKPNPICSKGNDITAE